MNFVLAFDRVQAGWLRGHLVIGTDRHELLASWMLDTPRLLVEAATDIVNGRAASVIWVEEPGSTVWQLEPDVRDVRLTIAACGLLTPPADWLPEHVEDYTTTRNSFGWAVLTAMEQLAGAVPPDRYADSSHWGKAFPTDALHDLRARLRQS